MKTAKKEKNIKFTSWGFYLGTFAFFIFLAFCLYSLPQIRALLKIKSFHFVFHEEKDKEFHSFFIQNQWQFTKQKKWIKRDLEQRTSYFLGRYIWEVSLSEILKTLKKNPWVKQAYMLRQFPSKFRIVLQIHTPVFVLIGREKKIQLINEEGNFLSHSQFWNAPILRGEVFQNNLHLRQKALKLILSLPQEGLFSAMSVSDIWYEETQGFSLFLLSSDMEVKLGTNYFEEKARRIEQVLKHLESEGWQGCVIDARFSKKIVVSLSNPA